MLSRTFSTFKPFRTSINVTVFGVNLPLGKYTSYLLKQNPLLSVLSLYGNDSVDNLANDLNQIDTRCIVNGYESENISKALLGSDVVLFLPEVNLCETTPIVDRILCESKRLVNLSIACTNYAPKAIQLVHVPPISVSTCIVEKIFKKTHWYHPGRIIGSAIYAQMKANTLLGWYQNMDPFKLHVPIIGGPDIDLAVPLFTNARPVVGVDAKHLPILMANYRNVAPKDFPKIHKKMNFTELCPFGEAYALNQLITLIGFGLCGDENVNAACYVRTRLVEHCRHLVSTVQFGKQGVVHNYGIPKLTKFELDLFERALFEIKERECMADEMVDCIEDNKNFTPSFKLQQLEDEKIANQKMYPQH